MRIPDVFQHYKEIHQVNLVTQDFSFSSDKEFLSWKKDVENSTNSKFRITYIYRRDVKTVIVYSCHRSGRRIVRSSSPSKRTTMSSKKLDAVCPAHIKLFRNNVDSTCAVSFLGTHLGHDPSAETEFEFLLGRKKIRQLIKKMASGTSTVGRRLANTNIDEIIAQHEANSRSRGRDIRSFSDDDLRNIDAFVGRYSQSVIFYRKHVKLQDGNNDAVLVFMTPAQQILLQKYGNNAVAVVSARQTRPFNYVLYILLAFDYDNESLPVAFAISNRGEVELQNIFFNCVRTKTGVLQPKVLVTDARECCYDSWKTVMGAAGSHVLCAWHIRETLMKSLKKINVKGKRKEISESLRQLLAERSTDTFEEMLQTLLADEDFDMSELLTRFRAEFAERAPLWASCYWKYGSANVCKQVETFYRSFKRICRKSDAAKSWYTRLTAITLTFESKLRSVLLAESYCGTTLRSKELRSAHRKYAAFAAEKENFIAVKKDENGWLIRAFRTSEGRRSPEVYSVRRLHRKCPVMENRNRDTCDLLCAECKVCGHLYCCTCAESALKNYMCEHIHAIMSTFCTNFENCGKLVNAGSLASESAISEQTCPVARTRIRENYTATELNLCSEVVSADCLRKDAEYLSKKLSDILTLVSADDQLNVLAKLLRPISPGVLNSICTTLVSFDENE